MVDTSQKNIRLAVIRQAIEDFLTKKKIIELGYGKIDTNVGAFVNKVVVEALEKEKKERERARWSKEAGG